MRRGSEAGLLPRAWGPGQQIDLRPASWLRPTLRSVQGYRIARRAGGTDDLDRRPHEQELGHAVGKQRREIEVLDVPDAMPGLQLGVAGYRLAIDLALGLGIVGRGVAAG